jgi:signal transduction histidine kinase
VLLYLALSLVGTAPVLFFIYDQTGRILVDAFKQRVHDREAILVGDYRRGGIPEVAREIRQRVESGATGYGVVLLVDPAGRRVEGNLAAWPPTLTKPTKWTVMRLYRGGHTEPESFALDTIHFSSGHRLLVGTLFEDQDRMRRALLLAIAGALFLAIPIGLAASLVLIGFVNRRVRAIDTVAARIAAGDLSRRVETLDTNEPFDRLGGSLNAMLARIETLVEELRLVTDGLAHDLRSPLMRIRASLDRAGEALTGTPAAPAMTAISREIEGMLRMTAGTLEISRTEAGIGRDDFAMFDLSALIVDLCELYQPLAEEQSLSIAVEKPPALAYFGNREMIGQAVSNLVDNAIKYGASGGAVRIGAEDRDSAIHLWVADQGAGIPPDRRAEAIRKYGRLDAARTSEGSGLGLALVGAVARLHGGELRIEDNAPGLRAVIVLPPDSGQAGRCPKASGLTGDFAPDTQPC